MASTTNGCFVSLHRRRCHSFISPVFFDLQQQIINISRTLGIPQIQVQAEQTAAEPTIEVKQVEDSASLPSDQPRILYQCGDCEELFKSLHLWQQHRREEKCQQPASEATAAAEPQPEHHTFLIQSSQSALNAAEALLVDESKGELQPDLVEKSLEEEEEEKAGAPLPQSLEPFSEAASSTANPEDSSPRKRGANKKPKPEPVLLCVDCGSCFGLVSELVAHRKTQHGFEEALHRCTVCGECFLNTTLFLYHRKQHKQLGEVPQDTSVFSSGFLVEQRDDGAPSLYRVAATFLEKSSFFCTRCGESFSDGAEFADHRKQKHDLPEPLHSCHCGETFMNTTQFLYHRRQHSVASGLGLAEESVTGQENAPGDPEDIPQSSKRLLSPSASTSEAFSPIPKRGRPSFRISSSSLKGARFIPPAHVPSLVLAFNAALCLFQEVRVVLPGTTRRAALRRTLTTPTTLHLPNCCRTGLARRCPTFAPTVAKPSPAAFSSALTSTDTLERSCSRAR